MGRGAGNVAVSQEWGASGVPEDVLRYWIDKVGPEGWYDDDPARDQEVRDRFEQAWERGLEGAHALWLTYPSGTLAYVILMDQFPRNMWRGSPKAFQSDGIALAAAKMAIARGWDRKIDEPARQFFYLPLMHSENLCDQDRSVRLIHTRLPETGDDNLLHAKAHRDVIRRFGRFPHRNEALGRTTQNSEAAFLKDGGYGRVVREIKASQAG